MNTKHNLYKRIVFLFGVVFLITSCDVGRSSLHSVSPTQKVNSSSCVGYPNPDFPTTWDQPTIYKLLSGAGYYTPRNVLGTSIGSSSNPLRVFINYNFFVALSHIAGTPFYQQRPAKLMYTFENDLSSSSGLTNVKINFLTSATYADVVVSTYDLSTVGDEALMLTLPINILSMLHEEDWFQTIMKAFGINYNHGKNKQAAIILDTQKGLEIWTNTIKYIIKEEETAHPHFVPTVDNMLPFVENTFIHEIGHVLGLCHSEETEYSYTMAQLGISIVPHYLLNTPSIETSSPNQYISYYAQLAYQMDLLPHSDFVKKAASLNANDLNSVKYIDRWDD